MAALIFAHGRSGSSELLRCIADANNLENFSNIGWEPFKRGSYSKYGYNQEIVTLTDLSLYIDHLSYLTIIKHLWTQITEDMNMTLLNALAFDRCVFLYRRSLFDSVISRIVARATQNWRHIKKMVPIGKVPPELVLQDIEELQCEQKLYAKLFSTAAQQKKKACVINYESLYGVAEGADVKQAALLSQVLDTLGFTDCVAKAENLAKKWLSQDKKYKSYEYYYEVVDNFNELYEQFGYANNFYTDNPADSPEALFGARN